MSHQRPAEQPHRDREPAPPPPVSPRGSLAGAAALAAPEAAELLALRDQEVVHAFGSLLPGDWEMGGCINVG